MNWGDNTSYILRAAINDSVTAMPVEANSNTVPVPFVLMRSGSSEKILVEDIGTDGGGAALTVVIRGYDSTTPEAHDDGTRFFVVVDKTGLLTLRSDQQFLAGTSLPVSATPGTMYFEEDTSIWNVATNSGWEKTGFMAKMKPPVIGDFSWFNGALTPVQTNGVLYLTNISGNTLSMFEKPLLYTTGNYSIDTMIYNYSNNTGSYCLPYVRDSVSGAMYCFGYRNFQLNTFMQRIVCYRFNNSTSQATIFDRNYAVTCCWNRIRFDSSTTTLSFQMSPDKLTWATLGTTNTSAFTSAFTHFGYIITVDSGGTGLLNKASGHIMDLDETQHV